MAILGAFSTVRFDADDGFVITGIRGVDSAAFRSFLDFLDAHARTPVQVYGLHGIDGRVWHDVLEQLDDPPHRDVKQIHLGLDRDLIVNRILPHDGFRDAWRIGSNVADKVHTGATDDVVFAQSGNDAVATAAGNDFVAGGNGIDRIIGGLGADILNGQSGHDVLFGGAGFDILRGGSGGDVMTGGAGADTFLFSAGDFAGHDGLDIIRDFDRGDGDQIVDTTKTLRVVDTGFVPRVHDTGTLLENRAGGLVFVDGVTLHQSDIHTQYVAPHTPGSGNPGIARGAAQVFNGPHAEVYSIKVLKSAAFFDGTHNVENYDVFIHNNTDTPIANLDDLKVRFDRAAGLDIVNANGATYQGGVFDVAGGTVFGDAETRIFGFQVRDRPHNIPLIDRTANGTLRPEDFNGDVISNATGFSITTRTFDIHAGGASAEVFIKNIGSKPLVDLDNLEFSFDEHVHISSTWGAKHYDDRFAVEPWGPDTPHGTLEPGQRLKLFGFSFDAAHDPGHVVDAHDFALTSKFIDLLS